jgi:hypothetical protein
MDVSDLVSDNVEASTVKMRDSSMDTAPESVEESFKIPALPPPVLNNTPFSADIAHIIASGLNEPDPADLLLKAQEGGGNHYDQVVKAMREKIGMIGAGVEGRGAELDKVQKEMEECGVTRKAGDDEEMKEGNDHEEDSEMKGWVQISSTSSYH